MLRGMFVSTREDFLKEKGAASLISILYLEAFALIKQHYGNEGATERLIKMGHVIAQSYYEYYKPPKKKLVSIIKDIVKNIIGLKGVKIKETRTPTEIRISLNVPDCQLCMPEVSVQDVHFCTPSMAIIENIVNLMLADGLVKKPFQTFSGEVLKSVSTGNDHCEWYYKVVE